ncbi:MAG: hypothetical protein ABJC19_00425 [Gemmatimonadota bacterium]
MNRLRFSVAVAGVALAVIALWRDDRRITWAAIVVLGVAVALRLIRPRPAPKQPEQP